VRTQANRLTLAGINAQVGRFRKHKNAHAAGDRDVAVNA